MLRILFAFYSCFWLYEFTLCLSWSNNQWKPEKSWEHFSPLSYAELQGFRLWEDTVDFSSIVFRSSATQPVAAMPCYPGTGWLSWRSLSEQFCPRFTVQHLYLPSHWRDRMPWLGFSHLSCPQTSVGSHGPQKTL